MTKAELEDKYLRALAEKENMRRRYEVQLTKEVTAAEARLLHRLLEVIDDIERAITVSAANNPEELAAGVALILDKAYHILRSEGVEAYQTIGRKFEARLMDAVAAMSTNTLPPGNVAEQLTCGYTRNGAVLRPAQVVVAQPEQGDSDE
jgi:molecular chaperone GrpE